MYLVPMHLGPYLGEVRAIAFVAWGRRLRISRRRFARGKHAAPRCPFPALPAWARRSETTCQQGHIWAEA